jgi:exoribonuclease-2
LPRHTKVLVRITGIDELTLDLHASLISRIEAPVAADEGEPEGDGDDDVLDNAGPLTLAIDLNDGETDPNAATPAPAA